LYNPPDLAQENKNLAVTAIENNQLQIRIFKI